MWFQERVNGDHSVISRENRNRWQSQCGINKVDGTHTVVSGENICQSQYGLNREWMAIRMWFQQRVDGNHSMMSRENR
jgi:hypothetical protein